MNDYNTIWIFLLNFLKEKWIVNLFKYVEQVQKIKRYNYSKFYKNTNLQSEKKKGGENEDWFGLLGFMAYQPL